MDAGPSLERLYSIRGDGSRRKLHPADVRGRFIRREPFPAEARALKRHKEYTAVAGVAR